MNTTAVLRKTSRGLSRTLLPVKKLAPMLKQKSKPLAVLLSVSLLCGCTHLNGMDTTGQAPKGKSYRQLVCSPWKGLPYNSDRDDPLTIRGVQEHNETGANLGCKKVAPNDWKR